MTLNDSLPRETAERCARLEEADLAAIMAAASLGLPPASLYRGIKAVANGEEFKLSGSLGQARPLKVDAWSFVNDHGQYWHVYGVSDAKAGELKGLLRTETDAAVKEITDLVTAALRKKGSTRPVIVVRTSVPGAGQTDHAPGSTGSPSAVLKAEIKKSPALYGQYKFRADDTGRPPPLSFRVRLGSGLYALGRSKQDAIDAARICRVHGRSYEPIRGLIYFWRPNKAPLSGPDIPEKVAFDGRLKPGEPLPPEPVDKDATKA